MKKLLSVFAAVAMLFGFASCSGDLHDDVKIDPNAMKGNWFYTVLDVTSITESLSIIFNDGTNQTVDITGIDPASGSVAYVWGAKTKADPATISTRTDCPDKSSLGGAGKLVVYCFSNAAKVNIWAWEGDVNITGGSWPGLAMDSDTAATLPIASIKKIEVTGLPNDLVGKELYLAGTLQPSGTWSEPGTDPSLLATITDNGDGTCTLTFDVNTDFDEGGYEFKFAAAGWATPEVCGFNETNEATDAGVTLKSGNTVVKGVYDNVGDDDKYRCTWSAE